MNSIDFKKNEEFIKLLKKATKPIIPVDFTEHIMGNVALLRINKSTSAKDMKRSYIFLVLAVLISFLSIFQLSYFEFAVSDLVNSYLPNLAAYITYVLLSLILGLIFYQLNNLLKYRFVEIKHIS
jgi:hypothetical protein